MNEQEVLLLQCDTHFHLRYFCFLSQVWKVKKAFKIYIFWKGLTPSFMVRAGVRLWDAGFVILVLKASFQIELDLNRKCCLSVREIRRIREKDGGIRQFGKRRFRCAYLLTGSLELGLRARCLFFTGDEIPVLPAVSSVCGWSHLCTCICEV